MRLPSFAILCCLCSTPALAEHGSPVMSVFPKAGAALRPNETISLLGQNGCPFYTLKKVLRRARPRLVSGQHQVPVKIVAAFCDQDGYGYSTTILKPGRRLRSGREYQLLVQRVTLRELRVRRQTKILGRWRVAGAADRVRPRWLGKPRQHRRSPIVTIAVSMAEKNMPVHFLLRGRPLGGGKPIRLIASMKDPNECAQVRFVAPAARVKRRYRMSITAMDPSGNVARAPAPLVVDFRRASAENLDGRRFATPVRVCTPRNLH